MKREKKPLILWLSDEDLKALAVATETPRISVVRCLAIECLNGRKYLDDLRKNTQ